MINTLTLEDVFYKRSEAEQKFYKLGLRKSKQLLKRLKSTPFCYWLMEGFDITQVWQIEKDLIQEQWILSDLIRAGKEVEE